MTRLRSVLVTATIVLPILLSLAALARDRMLWPFSHYPMYSGLHGPTAAITWAVGVVGDAGVCRCHDGSSPTGLHLHM